METPGEGPWVGHLAPGERLLWTGRPKAGIPLRPADLILVPFSVVWCALAFVAAASLLLSPTRLPSSLAIVAPVSPTLFLLVGAYLTVGRFAVELWERSRTRYGITTERIIVLSLHFGELRSVRLDELDGVALTKRADGSGTIFFGPTRHSTGFNQLSGWSKFRCGGCPPFEAVPNVNAVDEIIRAAQADASATGGSTGRAQ